VLIPTHDTECYVKIQPGLLVELYLDHREPAPLVYQIWRSLTSRRRRGANSSGTVMTVSCGCWVGSLLALRRLPPWMLAAAGNLIARGITGGCLWSTASLWAV
jgi:hypothetical protein